ncbi:MAG: hypothetical protein ACRET2_00610 [Steroidobacteraceae bacterium]
MTKKKGDISAKLRSGLAKEDAALEERFRRADSLLLRGTPATAPAEKRKASAASGGITDRMDRMAISLFPAESARLEELRHGLRKAGLFDVTRSQILRAGIEQLAKLSPDELQQVVGAIERGQPGRKPA